MNDLTYAHPLKRLVAFLVDGFILFFLDILVGILVNPRGGAINAQLGFSFDFSSPEKTISNFVNISYFVILTALWGATIGKRLLGIRVVDLHTAKIPSFGRVLLRETIGKFISGIILGLGFIWILFDKKKQGWHDKIAGTLVISVK